MGDWRDSVRSRLSEKTGAVRVCRKVAYLLLRIIAIGLRWFDCVLDSGRLMGDRCWWFAIWTVSSVRPSPGLRLTRSVCWTHAVAFREMRIAQILAFVQNAKWVLSSNDVLHTLINRKCG
jgi:hypothetical protein